MGRIATGSNFEFMKSIKLNEKQIENWNPKEVKAFLDGSIQKDFKRLYDIMKSWLIGKMTLDQKSLIPDDILVEIENLESVYNFE